MTAALFLGYTAAVACGLLAAVYRWLPTRAAFAFASFSLFLWLGWVGALSATGTLADQTLRPPAILYVAVPMAAILVALVFGPAYRFASGFPPAFLIGAQTFRVGVELLLHRLWQDGLVPAMLTWEGANFDVLIGLTAPFAAIAASRGGAWARLALGWNFAGVAMLANVVARAVLTAPGPLHLLASEVPNRLPGLFPYSYLAGFLAPLALLLHMLAIRALVERRGASDAAKSVSPESAKGA